MPRPNTHTEEPLAVEWLWRREKSDHLLIGPHVLGSRLRLDAGLVSVIRLFRLRIEIPLPVMGFCRS